ncbi:MAG TPA: class I adenylate-forming enzyme family protein [Usitatibacter sp.]|nr:class I adenylate-forming enzyme family protein [Usitatibacter sp.]
MLPGDFPCPHRGPTHAIEAEDRAWSYAELDDLSNRFGHYFASVPLARGDRASLLMANDAWVVGAYLGAFRTGIVANPINNRLAPEEIAYIVGHAGSRCLVVSEDFLPVVEKTLPLLAQQPTVLVAGDASLGSFPTTRPAVEVTAADGALLIYTSGTTGKPKGVLLTQANVEAGIEYVSRAFGMKAGDRTMCVMPLFHTNGLMFSTLPFLYKGATVCLRKRFSATKFWEHCRELRVSTSSVSPTILAMLLEHAENAPKASEIHLDYIKVASAPTPVELAERFEARFGKGLLLETYGLTETTAINVMNPVAGPRKHGSIGRALAPQEARIVDDARNPLPRGEVGEIEIRGATVMKEYFRDPENTRKALLPDGWLRTGDVARMDEDGFIFIVGRSKEMILRGGENISPLEIEEVAVRHPAVREVAAVGVPDRIWGETVGLCVVKRSEVSEQDLVEHCRAHLSAFKVPQRVVFVDELPRNAVGKVTRNALRGAFQ